LRKHLEWKVIAFGILTLTMSVCEYVEDLDRNYVIEMYVSFSITRKELSNK
jgi:hypothetical protein